MVVFADDSRGRFGSQQSQIEEGAVVREGQALVQLPDLSQMQVKVTIHESRVDQIKPDMPARITIQDREYQGRVIRIANQPERTSWFSANVKEYATTVSIEGETEGLRPGMTAKVTILVHNLTGVVTVPVSAVVEQREGFFCWVKTPRGPERRPLVLGRTNDKLIEVVDGVKEGDEVYRNPRAVVPEARQEPAFEKQFEDADFGGGEAGETGSGRVGKQREDSGPGGRQGEGGPSRGAGTPGDAEKGRGRGSFDLMQFDGDGDGKLSRDEVPERMRPVFGRLDANGDGFIDAAEVAAMRNRFRRDGGRPGGGGDARSGDGARRPGSPPP
jgi:HlyD family secretion protein